MKGLLVKDFKLLGLQKYSFLMIFVIGFALSFAKGNPAFILGFITFSVSMFTVTSISYDEFDNGNAFLFSLPITRKDYVIEKYLFGVIIGGGAWIFSLILALILNNYKGNVTNLEFFASSFLTIPFLFLLFSILLPVHLKFGREKSAVAIVAVTGLIFLVVAIAVAGSKRMGFDISNYLENLPVLELKETTALFLIIGVIIYLISMKISISIMEKKEF